MTNFYNNIDWNVVGALGQWAGAIATFMAVVVALYTAQNSIKPKLKLEFSEDEEFPPYEKPHTIYKFKAINIGVIPVTLVRSTIYIPKASETLVINITKKGRIETSETTQSIVTHKTIVDKLNHHKLYGKIKMKFSFTDSSGKEFQKTFYMENPKPTTPQMLPS